MMDNFDRHIGQIFGACMGVAMTALFGWPFGLGWLIGWGSAGLVIYGLLTGRITVRRKRSTSDSA